MSRALPKLESHDGEDYAVIMRPKDNTEDALLIARHPTPLRRAHIRELVRRSNAHAELHSTIQAAYGAFGLLAKGSLKGKRRTALLEHMRVMLGDALALAEGRTNG